MGYYVKIENEIVTNIIVADKSFIDFHEGEWIEIFYEDIYTKFSVGLGYTYDRENNTFIQ